ncbi:hypothetical protein JOM56_013020 [Amanita muscaria]
MQTPNQSINPLPVPNHTQPRQGSAQPLGHQKPAVTAPDNSSSIIPPLPIPYHTHPRRGKPPPLGYRYLTPPSTYPQVQTPPSGPQNVVRNIGDLSLEQVQDAENGVVRPQRADTNAVDSPPSVHTLAECKKVTKAIIAKPSKSAAYPELSWADPPKVPTHAAGSIERQLERLAITIPSYQNQTAETSKGANQFRTDPGSVSTCAANSSQTAKASTLARKKAKWYVVYVGRRTGVFDNWPYAQRLTSGVPGNCHVSFVSKDEAIAAYNSMKEAGLVSVCRCAGDSDKVFGAIETAMQ